MATRKGSGQKAKGKDLSSSPKPLKDLDQKVESLKGRKHPLDDEEDAGTHEGGEVLGMLDKFGADVSKAFLAKRQRVDTFAKTITKSLQQNMEQQWETQQKDRSKVAADYSSQFNVVLNQWDTDMTKAKEQQDKLMDGLSKFEETLAQQSVAKRLRPKTHQIDQHQSFPVRSVEGSANPVLGYSATLNAAPKEPLSRSMFQQQQKLMQQMRVSQRQRLNTLKQLLEQFTQALEAVEKTHNGQQQTLQSELRQEVAMLQKKVLMDTQQQDMAAMRKSLQSMMTMM